MKRMWLSVILSVYFTSSLPAADQFYVDNLTGQDQHNGLSESTINAVTGPVRTIRRALELADPGSTIHIQNNGQPYYESISLVGDRLSGDIGTPLTIRGNGATLSGLRQLSPAGWRREGHGLWKLTFTRKGYYQLLHNGFQVPEYRDESSADPRETLPLGQWCAYRGAVYYRQLGKADPEEERFDYAADEVGITLYQVAHVRIVDLTVEHFRVDGINAQNQCAHVSLENVVSRENGRAGLAVSGTSTVNFRQGRLERNGRESALIRGRAQLIVKDSGYDAEPRFEPSR